MNLNLKEEREKQGYSIEDIANTLKIRKKYIISIENGDYSDIPGEVYLNGYIKSYCYFLKIEVPSLKNEARPVMKSSVRDYRVNKYLVCLISLLLLLVLTTLYYNYAKDIDTDQQTITNNLIYTNEDTTLDSSY